MSPASQARISQKLLLGKGYRVVGLMRRSASSDVIGARVRWLGILDHVERLLIR